MPSLWRIHLADIDTRHVSLSAVHAVTSAWLDNDHHAATKPHAITPVHATDVGAAIDIGILDDTLISRLHTHVRTGTAIRLGRHHTIVTGIELIASDTWQDLAKPSGNAAWTLNFLTPTTFRHGSRFSPWPDPLTVIIGLHRRHTQHAPAPLELPRLRRDHLWISHTHGTTTHVELGENRVVPGFVGQITYRTDPGTPGIATIDTLLRLTRYSGIGAQTAYGLGVVELETTPTGPQRITSLHRVVSTAAQK